MQHSPRAKLFLITSHAQCEQGIVIGIGVPILESIVAFLYVELTGTFWMLIQMVWGWFRHFKI